MRTDFHADWASPPGDTIVDIMSEQEMSLDTLAKHIGYTRNYVNRLVRGDVPITSELAKKLSSALGSSEKFWLERESQYRLDVERLEQESQGRAKWLSKLPVNDMVKFGWIERKSDRVELATTCLHFFDVATLSGWQNKYAKLYKSATFRTSSSYTAKFESVVAWLRQGEIEAEAINCNPWDPKRLNNVLPLVRSLTREKDPEVFLPAIKEQLARCGVAVAIVRTPAKCPASGATYFLSRDKAALILSFRYLSDDHFWFSFFHEIGHLILHYDKGLFLEGSKGDGSNEEKEANKFAENILIPKEFQIEFRRLEVSDWKKIVRFAKKAGISPGIVVGQLQHLGIVKPNHLNNLKTRFTWE